MRSNIEVKIITEANVDTGYGHLSRCISLYQAFEEKDCLVNIIVNGDDTIKEIMKGKNHLIFNWLKEFERLCEILKESDIIIMDSYLANRDFYKKISEIAKIPVYIDDTLRINYPPGIIINNSLDPKKINQNNQFNLLGLKYCMLKKVFWDVPKKLVNKEIKCLMVTFGGSDMRNLTPKILQILNKNFPEIKKKVIIGKGFQNISEIENEQNINCNLIYFPTATKMKDIMLLSDIAITAGGQTIYELASIGVPSIIISDANNQINSVKNCEELGIIYYAGWWEDNNIHNNVIQMVLKLKNLILRKKMIKSGKKYIKPDGSRKIVNFLLKTLLNQNFIN